MLFQYDTSGFSADTRLYSDNRLVTRLPDKLDREEVDAILKKLGWRRTERWQKTQWGHEARLRKRER